MRIFIRSAGIYFLVAAALNFALRQDTQMGGMTFIALTFNVFGVFKLAFPITILFCWRAG